MNPKPMIKNIITVFLVLITVEVEDGVATLTGTVESWGEYRAAAENALEGGAIMVDNELEVSGPEE